MTYAERAITIAMQAVEDLPADDRLTDAVVLLEQARSKVADYVDGVPRSNDRSDGGSASSDEEDYNFDLSFLRDVVTKTESDGKRVRINLEGAKAQTLEADCALVAIGVVPLLPKCPEIGRDKKGYIQVDDRYQTTIPGIYAAGDVIGPPWLAHVASWEATQAVEGLFTDHRPKRITIFPGCTYCQPQVASAGLTEQAAKEKGLKYKVGKFPFSASGKALAVGESEGFMKVIIGEPYGEILGAHIIGPEATELIAELTLAMTLEATYEEIEATIHAHPTLSEAVHEATGAAFNLAIHI